MIKCPICGFSKYLVVYELDYGIVVQCGKCELVYGANLRLDDYLKCSYNEAYYKKRKTKDNAGYWDYFGIEREDRKKIAYSHLQILKSYGFRKKRILDVGCGGGYFIELAQKDNFEAYGIDASEYAISKAKSHGIKNIMQLDVLEFLTSMNTGLFDAICMFDFIEHVPNPCEIVKCSLNKMKCGGIIMMITPRYDSAYANGLDDEYMHYGRDHILYLTENSLRLMISKATNCKFSICNVKEAVKNTEGINSWAYKYYSEKRDKLLVTIFK
ncbi:class I SAM-dependent methyltransferase [bacterium]|nr:class I SAM-dependent methyltransferase [bacterium]